MRNHFSRKEFRIYLSILGSILGSALGFLTLRAIQYFQNLLLQPRLAPKPLPEILQDQTNLEERAIEIANQNLHAGIEPRLLPDGQVKLILCAGLRNFREPWARDFGFASFGLLALGEYQVTRQTLEAFLTNQRSNGQFPVKVHATNVIDRYLHSLFRRQQPNLTPIRPKYITAHNTVSLDGNALLVIAALNYAEHSGDQEFVRDHWEQLVRAITWLEEHTVENDGLLEQGSFADWADSIARQGRVLYTNLLYWKALSEMGRTARLLDYPHEQARFKPHAERIKQAINAYFWRQDLGYYVTSQIFDNLSSAGNLLAIAWDLTTPEQANSILDKMQAFKMAEPVPTRTVQRAYPSKYIAIENRLGGLSSYHTDAAWLWIGAWHVIACLKTGRVDLARDLFRRMACVIARDGEVHEVYAPDGQYLSTFWYTSEAPLTWSAGMVIYAWDFLEKTNRIALKTNALDDSLKKGA